ncbi:hypothetical protein MY3296_000461 [Beauveria thailandica]
MIRNETRMWMLPRFGRPKRRLAPAGDTSR